MDEALKDWARIVVMFVEAAAVLLIAVGAIEALWKAAASGVDATLGTKKLIWVHFARWLLLALEFQLAADILRTAVQPSWNDIGQLGAIAGIRTFLGFFLERDMESAIRYEDARIGGAEAKAEETRAPDPA